MILRPSIRMTGWLLASLVALGKASHPQPLQISQPASPAHPEEPVTRTPLQVRLDVPLDSRHTQVDAPVFATMKIPWKGPSCSLAKGAMVSGHVLAVTPRGKEKTTATITVQFDKADCNGIKGTPLGLVLYAVLDTTQDVARQGMKDTAGIFGSISAHSSATLGGGHTPTENIPTSTSVRTDVSGGLTDVTGRDRIVAGKVIGLEHVELSVGTGPERSSVLHSAKTDFRVNTGADLVLVMLPKVSPTAPMLERHTDAVVRPESKELPAAPVMPPPPPPVLKDDTEVCSTDCSNVSDKATAPSLATGTGYGLASILHHTSASIAVARFGYRPANHPEMFGFDHETTIHYLSDREILLTFDPHRLRERNSESWHAGSRRIVRAVLIDTVTHKVTRAVDWVVEGDGQYLWDAGAGKVLVHMKGSLRLLGSGLRESAVFPAQGDLAWVTVSPSAKLLAYGILRERHDRETHESIQRLAGRKPEEDVEMRLLDMTGKVILERSGESAMVPPVLTDEGEALVLAEGRNRWKLFEQNPDGSVTRTIAMLNSDCEPQISSPLKDAFFVVGCAPESGQRWYRVLRSDGHTLLKGKPSTRQIEQSAKSGGPEVFAVRTIDLSVSIPYGGDFKTTELQSEQVDVRRARDGKSLMTTETLRFPPSHDAYSLAPNGRQLALVTLSGVEIYTVPAP